MPQKERQRSLLRAVELYYYDGLTQAAIADRLGCTRWTVGRLLKEAIDTGVVEIIVRHPQGRRRDLEEQLESAFGLSGAQVVPTQRNVGETGALVARLAGNYLADLRPHPRSVGIGWGRTTAAMARAIPDHWGNGVKVVQLSGAPENVGEQVSTGPVSLLARKARGVGMLIPTVSVTQSIGEAQRAKRDPRVVASLGVAQGVEVALYSPGAFPGEDLLVRAGGVSSRDIERVTRQGAVGTVLNRYIDHEGHSVDGELENRTVGLTLEGLRAVRVKAAIGYGEEKRHVFLGLIKGRLANTLLVDSSLAESLLTAVA